jgi:hypothetical protein
MSAAEIFTSRDPVLLLGRVTVNGEELTLTRGIGSSLYHKRGDPLNVFYSITDRGPNIDRDDGEAKIFPQPNFAPTIHQIELMADGKFTIIRTLPLSDRDGNPITGRPNPKRRTAMERAYDNMGREIELDPNGLDTEGLVALADGTFWLADEYGPSLVHVAADGRIIERLVPLGSEAEFSAASYTVRGTLPSILGKRHLNRGFEGIAASADERYLYAMMQNPLANPDIAAYKTANATRLFKIDAASGVPVAEFVYLLDPHPTFDDDTDADKQSDVRVSEIEAFGPDKLIVLERVTHTTKLYAINLATGTDILGTAWDAAATSPSLEQANLVSVGIKPVAKALWLDSGQRDDIQSKIEGVAFLAPDTLVLINDNDFGIEGAATTIRRLRLPPPAI